MKSIAIIIFCFLSVNQNARSQNLSKFSIKGQLTSTYRNQGGAELIGEPLPAPLANTNLLVVEIADSNRVPKVVGEITSDSLGYFSITLPPGKYGFVSKQDSIELNQCLPATVDVSSQWQHHSIFWEIKPNCPIVIENKAIENIELIRREVKVCYSCP